MDRRNFFVQMMSAAAAASASSEIFFPPKLDATFNATAQPGKDQEFWDSFFDDVDPTKPHAGATRGPNGVPPMQPLSNSADPKKLPRFFHYEDTKGFRFAEAIERNELPKLSGAAIVSISISGFHPSDEDGKKIGDVAAAQLQLHAAQTSPIAQYIAPLAWASLATVFHDKAGHLPTVDQLNFLSPSGSGTPSTANRILYPKAEGKLALNVTLPEKHSLLHKMISTSLKVAEIAAPLVSLPAISVPAIQAFTRFYNILQQNAGFIVNCPLKDVVASYEAVDSGNMHADALKLITGQYLIVPDAFSDVFRGQMEKYKMVGGYLVPKTLTASEDPRALARSSLREITYTTLKVSVERPSSSIS